MKVLVTGAAGFIGSHICDAFVRRGHSVVGVDNESSGVAYWQEGVERIRGDIGALHPAALLDRDVVVHAAAYADIRHNWDAASERKRLFENNISRTIGLLEATPEKATTIFLSSASVYGSARKSYDPMDEAAERRPESPYAASKIAGEALMTTYAYKTGRRNYNLRLSNVVGARMHRGVIRDFVTMMREKGRIHALDDGRQQKTWVHVLDVAEAIATLAMHDAASAAPSGAYNVTACTLGSDRLSWWNIVDAMGIDRASVTYEDRPRGSIGDPWCVALSGAKLAPWYTCDRSIYDGIRDALDSLGWIAPIAPTHRLVVSGHH